MMSDALAITALTASAMASEIASGRLSAREVVEAHLRRIDTVNGRLNAVVLPLFAQARAVGQAAAAARDLRPRPGPLHRAPLPRHGRSDPPPRPATRGPPGP